MPRNIWDVVQKYFLTLNKAETYGRDAHAMCKNKMREKERRKSKSQEREETDCIYVWNWKQLYNLTMTERIINTVLK